MVEFSCATPDSEAYLSWDTMPDVGTTTEMVTSLPGGGELSVLSFTAAAQHNNTEIKCIAVDLPRVNRSTALLLVQGKPIRII